jgi:hypothetical protein
MIVRIARAKVGNRQAPVSQAPLHTAGLFLCPPASPRPLRGCLRSPPFSEPPSPTPQPPHPPEQGRAIGPSRSEGLDKRVEPPAQAIRSSPAPLEPVRPERTQNQVTIRCLFWYQQPLEGG